MQAGDVVDGRFTLEAIAGHGGMGTVWRAREAASGDVVAIKVLRTEQGEARERFAREIRVLAGLRHPGVVRYIDSGVSAGEMWLAMEWLDGETLGQRTVRLALTPAESLDVARRVAEALGAAHGKGVKPSVILAIIDATAD